MRTAKALWEEPGCDISSELGPGSIGAGWSQGAAARSSGSPERGRRQMKTRESLREAGLGSAQR